MSPELASAGPISAYDGSPLIILIPGFDNISKAAELGCSGKAAPGPATFSAPAWSGGVGIGHALCRGCVGRR